MLAAGRPDRRALVRALDGARSAVLVGLGAGAALGLVTEIPLVIAIGIGSISSVVTGAIVALVRSR